MSDLDRVIWGTNWCWHDVMCVLEESQREKFESLPPEIQTEIMDSCQRDLAKGMESGVMHDWSAIMDTAIDCSGLNNEIDAQFFDHEQQTHGKSE